MLSFALEYNCCSLIRDCLNCWSDGSFSGNLGTKTGLSLLVIINWLCKRSDCIENRCKYLSKGLLESSGGYALDQREQRELSILIRQLKLLKELASDIIKKSKSNNNDYLCKNLEKKLKLLQACDFFYPVVLWLFNIGILPASSMPYANLNYNFNELELFFKKRRAFLKECSPNKKNKQGKGKLVHLLFIDAFIQHVSHNDELTSHWQAIGGNGFYPPPTLSAMLDILLFTELDLESKTILLLYFFLDLHASLEHVHACKAMLAKLVKFPTVFQINTNLIKLVQTFWFLDHGNFAQANIDEFLSIVKQNHKKEWLLDLLLQILVSQNESELALRVFQSAPTLIAPALKLRTLLANDLITEAFQIARSERILEVFFDYCITKGKYAIIRDLALTEQEGAILLRLLKNCKEYYAENLQFVYLLSRNKYIEAVAYMDELSKKKGLQHKQKGVIENSNLVLSAFNTTMAPMSQGLTDIYFRIQNKLRHKEVQNKTPVPLSCQLIKENANSLLGGMYHSSVLSAHFATHYLHEVNKDLLYSDNVPFLRKPQLEALCYDAERQHKVSMPQPYKGNLKRGLEHERSFEETVAQENPQKRRKVLGQDIIEDLTLKHGTTARELAEKQQKLNETFKIMDNKKSSLKSDDWPKMQKNVNFNEENVIKQTETPKISQYWTDLRNMASDYTSKTLNQEKAREEEVEVEEVVVHRKEVTTSIDSEEVEQMEVEQELEESMEQESILRKSTTTTIDENEEQAQMETSTDTGINSTTHSSLLFNVEPRKPLSHVDLSNFSTAGDSGLYKTALTSATTTMLTEIKTSEFGPKVCSTAVAEADGKLADNALKTEIIYTECTTVIDDTETYIGLSLQNKTPEIDEKSQTAQKVHLLETTLDWEDNSISANNSQEEEDIEQELYNTATEIETSQLNESELNENVQPAEEIISLDDDNEDVVNSQEAQHVEEDIISIGDDSDESKLSTSGSDENELSASVDVDDPDPDTSLDVDLGEEEDLSLVISIEDNEDFEDSASSKNTSALDTSNEQNDSFYVESETVDDVDFDELVNMPIAQEKEASVAVSNIPFSMDYNLNDELLLVNFGNAIDEVGTTNEENSQADDFDDLQTPSIENSMSENNLLITNVISLRQIEEKIEEATPIEEQSVIEILPESESQAKKETARNEKVANENQILISDEESFNENEDVTVEKENVAEVVIESVCQAREVEANSELVQNVEDLPTAKNEEVSIENQILISDEESFKETEEITVEKETLMEVVVENASQAKEDSEKVVDDVDSSQQMEDLPTAKNEELSNENQILISDAESFKETEEVTVEKETLMEVVVENESKVVEIVSEIVESSVTKEILSESTPVKDITEKIEPAEKEVEIEIETKQSDSQSKEESERKEADSESKMDTVTKEFNSLSKEESALKETESQSEAANEKVPVQETASLSKDENVIQSKIGLEVPASSSLTEQKTPQIDESKKVENSSEDPNSSSQLILSISNTSSEFNESSDMSIHINTPESAEKVHNRKARSVSRPRSTKKQEDEINDEPLVKRRTNERGISVPPQVVDELKSNLTDRAYNSNRMYRSTSVQPREHVDSPTPLKRTKSNRGSTAHLNDLSPNVDSPSQNTRSRRRLLSDNESDISMVSETQTNYSGKSRPKSRASTIQEESMETPKKRKRRAASVVTEENETNDSKDDETANKKGRDIAQDETREQRRLTRNQLAMLEKANAQVAAYASSQKTDDSESLKSSSSRRLTRSSLKVSKNRFFLFIGRQSFETKGVTL